MPFPKILRNQRGIALLYLVVLFTLLGVLVSAGVKMFSSSVTAGKINETKNALERDALIITAWGVKNGHLPTFADYSGNVFGSKPVDSWGKPLTFAPYSSLTKESVCGRSSSPIKYHSQDVAFMLFSGGDDMNISSSTNTDGTTHELINLKPDDLYRIVTLNELQAQAGCFGVTQGSLKILNNELPAACKRRAYSSTIFMDGGSAHYAAYSTSGLPAGFSNSGPLIFGTSTTAAKSYPVTVTVTDSAYNKVKRSYVFRLISSCL